MSEAYIALGSALGGAAAGGILTLVGTLLSNRSSEKRLKEQFDHEASQRKAELLRQRGEELYVAAHRWVHELAGIHIARLSVMRGELTYNQALDLDIKHGEQREDRVTEMFNRIELLVDAYFPSTRPAYDKLIQCRDRLAEIEAAYKAAYKRGDEGGSNYLKPYTQAQLDTSEAGESFKARVLDCIRAI